MRSTSTDHQYGTYAALRVLPPSAQWLYDHMQSLGISAVKTEVENRLHCTLIYSRVPCPTMRANQELVHVANFLRYDLFTAGEKKALVMVLSAPSVLQRHNELMLEHGASYDHPEYIPHVTLTYDFEGSIEGLPSINFPVMLGKEYVEPLED